MRLLLLGAIVAGASGCRHKVKVAAVTIPPPQQLPVDTTAKVPPPQPVVEKVPLQPTPLPAVVVPTKKKKVRRARKPSVAAAASSSGASAPQAQTASVAPTPEADAIGALTPGGSESPQLRRQATELISMLEKRLAGLPADTREKQKDSIARVMNFRRQAQAALDSGDAEGAVTLATKAKLLLGDLLK